MSLIPELNRCLDGQRCLVSFPTDHSRTSAARSCSPPSHRTFPSLLLPELRPGTPRRKGCIAALPVHTRWLPRVLAPPPGSALPVAPTHRSCLSDILGNDFRTATTSVRS